MKIYTKTGDKGQTSLYGGTRVSKADARVETYGTLDELNSFLGVARAANSDKILEEQFTNIQYQLFTVGSEIATPPEKMVLANGTSRLPQQIGQEEVTELESWIDAWEETLTPLQYFILPAGGQLSAHLHVCRTIARRAERDMVYLQSQSEVRPVLLEYLNRLSDYFFVAARVASSLAGTPESYWIPREK